MDKISEFIKIQITVPVDFIDKVRMAIGEAGGGKLGNYSHCTFVTYGDGYFLPLEGANPAVGEIGKIEKVKEGKIEFICKKDDLNIIWKAIRDNHPYEEIALDIFPLLDLELET